MDLPMSTTMEDLMKIMPYLINPKIICVSCQDRSQCDECYFKPRSKPALPKSRLTELLQKYFSTVPEKKLTLNKRYL
jgi:hypothetical protein